MEGCIKSWVVAEYPAVRRRIVRHRMTTIDETGRRYEKSKGKLLTY